MRPNVQPPRANNFDLIRLLAAMQVAVFHGWEHLRLPRDSGAGRVFVRAVRHLPGVPIFFVLSGFLIPWAWSRTRGVGQYAQNRFLRMFPAMWAALAVSVAVMVAHGAITFDTIRSRTMIAWLAAQVSVGQFYTAPELRGYGLGNPNGSLWTIVVEIQFYLLVPVILSLAGSARTRANAVLLALFAGSVLANVGIARLDPTATVSKILGVTIAPFLFYFLLGSMAWLNWDVLRRIFTGRRRAALWFTLFVSYSSIVGEFAALYSPSYWVGSAYNLVATTLLAGAVLAFAFADDAASRTLRGNDLSYGVYLYHGIVLNVLVQHRLRSGWAFVGLIAASLCAAALSWRLVERPALARKRAVTEPRPGALPAATAEAIATTKAVAPEASSL